MSKLLGEMKVHEMSKDGINDFILSLAKKQDESQPFYILDLGKVESIIQKWEKHLPNIKPYYAAKCNNEPSLLAALASLGANFDCTSRAEMESVLALGVSPDRIIYANPCKGLSHLKFAAKVGINLTTFDSKFELEKIKKWHPKCSLILRIRIMNDDESSMRPLGSKFGALPEEIELLLQEAQETGLDVVGVSFHVGCVATNPLIYRDAVYAVKKVFDAASKLGMPPMHVVDIGGGFRDNPLFNEIADNIKDAIKDCFFDENHVVPKLMVMAEPGRFFAETAFTLVTSVIGKRVRGLKREYWINEGVYGSFSLSAFNRSLMSIKPLLRDTTDQSCVRVVFQSTILGHTCDSVDVVISETILPELQVDDLLVYHNMGAYTISTGTSFNGFSTSSTPVYLVYTNIA